MVIQVDGRDIMKGLKKRGTVPTKPKKRSRRPCYGGLDSRDVGVGNLGEHFMERKGEYKEEFREGTIYKL